MANGGFGSAVKGPGQWLVRDGRNSALLASTRNAPQWAENNRVSSLLILQLSASSFQHPFGQSEENPGGGSGSSAFGERMELGRPPVELGLLSRSVGTASSGLPAKARVTSLFIPF
ncbi:hypothetical protein KQX54_019223 [Cotesia glomerata]|uniref:Uncharacterized protein n=1 Tax=Cotesia glomerata TaxID=32391 RepID=A0AAV7J1P9_COTGL|nr:hypothetical protein KQX54_019223 [Cotesia glomerata]